MADFQVAFVDLLAHATTVRALMHTTWGWPAAESLHFMGLTLLVSAVVFFDLRLLGLGRRIPIAAMHRVIGWGVAGFAINVVTGSMFLMAEPDQYVYNPAFQFKVLFLAVAGLNAAAFYLISYREIARPGVLVAPRPARVIATISLCMWIGVIVAGRFLTFYRPFPCGTQGPGTIATCIPSYHSRY